MAPEVGYTYALATDATSADCYCFSEGMWMAALAHERLICWWCWIHAMLKYIPRCLASLGTAFTWAPTLTCMCGMDVCMYVCTYKLKGDPLFVVPLHLYVVMWRENRLQVLARRHAVHNGLWPTAVRPRWVHASVSSTCQLVNVCMYVCMRICVISAFDCFAKFSKLAF